MKRIYPVLVLTAFCVLSCHSGDSNDSALDERREAKCYDSGGDYYKGICYCDDIACPKGRYCDTETGQCEIKQSAAEKQLETACVESDGVFQDGICICNDVPCEDKHVCAPDTLECAKDAVPQDPDPQEPDPKDPPAPTDCVSSGGTLLSGMCFCNGNLCDPGIFCNEIGICSNREEKIEASCTSSGGVYKNGSCFCNETACNPGIYCSENGHCSDEFIPVIADECKNDNADYWCKDGEVLHCYADSHGNISVSSAATCAFGCSTQDALKPDGEKQYSESDAKNILCRECNEDLNRCEGDAIYTCNSGKRIETKCMLNNSPVSCKNDKECGKCMNDAYECYNVTLNNGSADVEIGIKTMCIKGEWHEVDKKDLKNDNPKLSTLLDQFSCNYNSCRKDGTCGVCTNGFEGCINNNQGIGRLRNCVDGAWNDLESCDNVSCAGQGCGDCINDTVKECEQYCTDGNEECDNSKKGFRSGVCKNGKWIYSECTPEQG